MQLLPKFDSCTRHGVRPEVVVLDRDGTLVEDPGYNSDPHKLVFLPGVAAGVRDLTQAGYGLVVITNQSGVGRGYFTEADVLAANARLVKMVADAGGSLAAVYYCPHAPAVRCNCRKPEVGMMLQAAAELGFDARLAVVVGDKESDVELASRSGSRSILLAKPGAVESRADFVVATFAEVTRLILERIVWREEQ